MALLDKDQIKEIVDFMKENKMLVFATGDIKIELSPQGIFDFHKERREREEPVKREKIKPKKEKDDLADFIYGNGKINKEDLGALYGI